MLKLRIQDDGGEESEVSIARDEITIGRAESNTIRLTARNVSREHAKLVREGDALYIEAVSARYGIVKNGAKISEDRALFTHNDIIVIGDYRLSLNAPKAPVLAAGDFSSEPTEIKSLDETIPKRSGFEGTEILPAMPAKIVIVSSNFAGQEFPLSRKEIVIGRGEECDIIVDHRSVSQKHAKIVRETGKDYQIVDLNSKNGVCIQGEKYTSTYLKRGDIVELGHVKFRFVEPGENYIFTPQSIIPDDEDDAYASPAPSASSVANNAPKIGALIALVVVFLFAAVGIWYVVSSDDGTAPGDGIEAVAKNTKASEQGSSDVKTPILDVQSDDLGPKIARGVEQARKSLAKGDVDKAIGVLEGMKMMDPSPKELKAIEKLIVDARAEKPFKADYMLASQHLKEQDYEQALERIKKIPDHTLFAKLIREQDWDKKALAGLLEQARQSKEDGERTEAKAIANKVLSFDGKNEGAKTLLAELDEPTQVAVKTPKKVTEPTSPIKNNKPVKKVKKRPKEPAVKLSTLEATALRKSAIKKMMGGDFSGARSDCTKALKAGVRDCQRIIGVTYAKEGNKAKACKSFRKAARSSSSAQRVQKEIDRLGCQ